MQSQIPLTVQMLGLSLVLILHNFLINEPAALAVTPMKMQIRNVHGQLPKLHLLLSLLQIIQAIVNCKQQREEKRFPLF